SRSASWAMWVCRALSMPWSGSWGNPHQLGVLDYTSDDTAVFTSSAGTVTFHRTSRVEPPFICS
ncbi:MAG: hypothetical protein WA912_06150, partial [Ornithinimicrobium sp.]